MRMSTRPVPMLVVITSLIFLNAKCSTPAPRVDDSEQCSVFLKIVDKQVVAEDSRCNCRLYRFDKNFIGAVDYTQEQLDEAVAADTDGDILIANTRYIQRKLSYCHTVTGWSNQKRNENKSWYAIITAYWEAIRQWALSP